MSFSAVVLPEPLGPTKATASPVSMARFRDERACKFLKWTETSSRTIAGGEVALALAEGRSLLDFIE
jgi:hypothetical protein